jgi:hypothetical protein
VVLTASRINHVGRVYPQASQFSRRHTRGCVDASCTVWICVAHIVEASVPDAVTSDTATPLVYHGRTWHQLGSHSSI